MSARNPIIFVKEKGLPPISITPTLDNTLLHNFYLMYLTVQTIISKLPYLSAQRQLIYLPHHFELCSLACSTLATDGMVYHEVTVSIRRVGSECGVQKVRYIC